IPKALAGIEPPTLMKCRNGAGLGVPVTHSSGHAPCVPCVSFETSNEIVPVRPAKLNGCFGYIVSAVTVPASYAPVALSFDDCRSWPLQMMMSVPGCAGCGPLQPSSVEGTQGNI